MKKQLIALLISLAVLPSIIACDAPQVIEGTNMPTNLLEDSAFYAPPPPPSSLELKYTYTNHEITVMAHMDRDQYLTWSTDLFSYYLSHDAIGQIGLHERSESNGFFANHYFTYAESLPAVSTNRLFFAFATTPVGETIPDADERVILVEYVAPKDDFDYNITLKFGYSYPFERIIIRDPETNESH
jgi:hypothetical protein